MKKELNKTKSVFVKKSKMSLAKSTTALTCLVGALIISSDLGLAQTTTTGSMIASGSAHHNEKEEEEDHHHNNKERAPAASGCRQLS